MEATMAQTAIHKLRLSKAQRLRRLLLACVDLRAWAHACKVVNYYNYTHVAELRKVTRGRKVVISPLAGFANGQNIILGDGCRIGANCYLWAGPGRGRIVLDRDVMLGPQVMISASNYRFNEGSPVTAQAMKEADILIGRDVWIGYGAVILAGAEIGDGCIIGAGSVVRGRIEPFSILGGNPAQVVGRREDISQLW
jgi:acetyltransferase-like isoleucine patch superfamily enzyme